MPDNAEDNRLWRLDSPDCSVVLASQGGAVPALLYFGPSISANDHLFPTQTNALTLLTSAPTAKASMDSAGILKLVPTDSDGYFNYPGMSVYRLAGNAMQAGLHGSGFSPRLSLRQTTPDEPAGAPAGTQRLVFVYTDSTAGFDLTQTVTLHSAGSVLSIDTRLDNTGDTPLQIDWLASATLPLPFEFNECLSFNGRWGLEFQPRRSRFDQHSLVFENRSGRSSQHHPPFLVTGVEGFNENRGPLIGCQLAFSGNHQLRIERLPDGFACLQAGVLLRPGELSLSPGEHWQTPPVHFCQAAGLNPMSQRFHRFMRDCILPQWTRTPRPIHANSWEALYFDHELPKLMQLADLAAATGAERFVLDDGWFLGRRDDTAGLGDWVVDPERYPDGLHPLVDHVRSLGLQFGLWFEPEMVNADSNLYRQHPDWVLRIDGHPIITARNQYVLNLSEAGVLDYLQSAISSLVNEYRIDYIKWDMNRHLVQPGDGRRARALVQTEKLYELLRCLTSAHPDLEIETCASGGGRVDAGILQHTGRVWTSDNIDPVDRLTIQRSFSLFFPAEIMGAHIGAATAHVTSRTTSLDFRAIVALQGQPGLELDLREADDEQQRVIHHYLDLYKTHRGWLNQATRWQLPARLPGLHLSGQVSPDQRSSLWTIATDRSLGSIQAGTLVLQGLDAGLDYAIAVENHDIETFRAGSEALPDWITQPHRYPGELLMNVGLRLPILPPQQALLLSVTAEAET